MVYKFYSGNNQVPKEKGPTTTLVYCLCPTGQTGSSNRSDRSAWIPHVNYRSDRSKQNRGIAPSAFKRAIHQIPNLRVSLHDLPPLCIPADELDTTGAEVDVLGS